MEWLSDEQQAAWRPFVALLLRLPAALDAQLQKDAGITQFDYLVLSGLSEAPGRTLRMSELAATANSSLSRLSHVVSRLEGKGWVRREPCPGDGRFINAVLTDEGWQKVLATAPGHVAAVRERLIGTLTEEEFAQLGAISAKVLAAQGIKIVIPNESADSRPPGYPGTRRYRPGTTRPDS
jgi:DNA-binding MarR family transcriptional regulator